MIGPEGWCVHFERNTRTCSIYAGELLFLVSCLEFWSVIGELFELFSFVVVDRPYFCRVEPDIFEQLYGFEKKKFNKEACRSIPVHYLFLTNLKLT